MLETTSSFYNSTYSTNMMQQNQQQIISTGTTGNQLSQYTQDLESYYLSPQSTTLPQEYIEYYPYQGLLREIKHSKKAQKMMQQNGKISRKTKMIRKTSQKFSPEFLNNSISFRKMSIKQQQKQKLQKMMNKTRGYISGIHNQSNYSNLRVNKSSMVQQQEQRSCLTQRKVFKQEIFNMLMNLKKQYNFSEKTIIQAVILLVKFTNKIYPNQNQYYMITEGQLNHLKLCSLSILCLSSKFQERQNFKISELAIELGLIKTNKYEPEYYRTLECEVLKVLGFKLCFDEVDLQEASLDLVVKQLQLAKNLSENILSNLREVSLHLSLNQIIYQSDINQSDSQAMAKSSVSDIQEIVVASIYIASKVIEKRGLLSKLVDKETFSYLLKQQGNLNEQRVIKCASLIFQTMQQTHNQCNCSF